MRKKSYSKMSGSVTAKTDKALCVDGEWYPMSQIKDLVINGDVAAFSVPDWLLNKKRQETVIDEAKSFPVEASVAVEKPPLQVQNWAICDECKGDTFNICKSGKLYFVQCAECGKQLSLL